MSDYLVVTGMSGAGRSTAGATLEDLGWFVIDNMPSRSSARWPSWWPGRARSWSGWRS